jgi:iron complex outermembrane receptor protein
MLGLDARQGPWLARAELDGVDAQQRVPATDRATAGYTLVNLSLSRRVDLGGSTRALWFLRLNNLGDKLAYSATTTASVRDLVPLPGRSIKGGVRVDF